MLPLFRLQRVLEIPIQLHPGHVRSISIDTNVGHDRACSMFRILAMLALELARIAARSRRSFSPIDLLPSPSAEVSPIRRQRKSEPLVHV